MKKIVGLVLVLMTFVALNAFAAGDAAPVKLSLFPKITVPQNNVVHGLDLGILATDLDEVQGVQLSFIYGAVENKMVGLQNTFIFARATSMTGLQVAFVTKATTLTGVQYGFVNRAQEVTGVQLGFVNITEKMKGIQVGLVNVIKQGIVPAMVLVNASF